MKHWYRGIVDFAGRYRQAFAAAWRMRAQWETQPRTAEELAFLPAVLELVERPVSPTARWTMRIIITLFCVTLLWAMVGQLDIVAVAPGKTVASSRTKVIQPLETAVIRRILVRDGQLVRQGDLLVELDATATAAEFQQADEALVAARLNELRLTAMLDAQDTAVLPDPPSDTDLPEERLAAQWLLAASEVAEYQARRESLLAVIAQRRAQEDTVRSQLAPLGRGVEIARERLAAVQRLLGEQYVSRHDYLARQQELVEMERLLTTQQATLVETHSALVGAREELRVLETDARQQIHDALRQAREQIRQYAPQVDKTRQRDRLMQLRAPVDGMVQQLAVHTVGGVVTPAQALMAVVPNLEPLEVEATVLNKDIGFVRPGQRATVKVESFPYTRYGYLEGVVESVSHDAAQDERLGLVFPARVRLQGSSFLIEGIEVALTPGMSLSVEIKTGRRRVIDYLLSPLKQHGSEAFRER